MTYPGTANTTKMPRVQRSLASSEAVESTAFRMAGSERVLP